MKTNRLRNRSLFAALLAATTLPVAATPVQYTLDFSFSAFASQRNMTGLPDGLPTPFDPVSGSVSFTVDLGSKPSEAQGFVDSMSLSSATPAFSTSAVHFYVAKVQDGGGYFHYSLSLGRYVPGGQFIPDNYFNVYWGTDDFNMTFDNIEYLNAGSMLIYSNPGKDDAWITWNGVVTKGTPPVIDPGPGPGPGPVNPTPEPGSLALVSLGLLCGTWSLRPTGRRAAAAAADAAAGRP